MELDQEPDHTLDNMNKTFTRGPPPYGRHDWKSAKRFWDTRESWSFLRWLKEAFYLHREIFKSSYTPEDLHYCKYRFHQAIYQTKSFRREIKRGVARTEILELDRERVYGLYAQSMNDIEKCTDYRFPVHVDEVDGSYIWNQSGCKGAFIEECV